MQYVCLKIIKQVNLTWLQNVTKFITVNEHYIILVEQVYRCDEKMPANQLFDFDLFSDYPVFFDFG